MRALSKPSYYHRYFYSFTKVSNVPQDLGSRAIYFVIAIIIIIIFPKVLMILEIANIIILIIIIIIKILYSRY